MQQQKKVEARMKNINKAFMKLARPSKEKD